MEILLDGSHKELNWQGVFLPMSIRGGSRTAATSKMEHFVIILNGWEPLTIVTKTPSLMLQHLYPPLLILPIRQKTNSQPLRPTRENTYNFCTKCPAKIYLSKVSNRNTRKRYELCSKLTMKTPEHFTSFSSVSIVDFEQITVSWVSTLIFKVKTLYFQV